MSKLKVCFFEFNVRMGKFCYLPIVSGILRAYAEADPEIRERYEFLPFVYAMDSVPNVWKAITGVPDIAAFSVSMWNEQLCLEVARRLKQEHGHRVSIVFGGYSVPHHPKEYMEKYPFIDICVRSEGEESFKGILKWETTSDLYRTLEGIPGIAWRKTCGDGGVTDVVENKEEWPFVKDLDQYPSPYLTGQFNYLLDKGEVWQAIIETNRGCLAVGTEVTIKGGRKRIEDVQRGEEVLGWDEAAGELSWNRVWKSVCTGTKPTLRITAGDTNVRATEDHPFLTDRGWLRTDQLRVGDFVLLSLRSAAEAEGKRNLFAGVRGKFSESRLHSQEEGRQTSDFSARDVLAPGSEVGGGRVGGLPGQGLGMLRDLGTRQIRRANGERCSEVRWARISSIEPAGVCKVYDLVNCEPCPNFFADGILAHNCSFPCSFCAWGRGGTTTRYRFHSMERVKAEIDWCGEHKIPYVFNADANFGMHPRDQEIATYLVETKKKYGYPDKFRTCFGKNTDDKIFKTATTLHAAGMEKGITLARQSNDPTTLENIRRQNISLETYRRLQERFNDTGIPVYVELILGLPGETLESWKKGIDDCLTKAGSKNSLFVYMCQVLPNTELADPEYQKKHGIRTKRIELQEIHGSPRGLGWVKEYEDIVIATASMPYDQWREAAKFSWATMLLHSMKAGFFVMAWLWDRFQIPPSYLIDELSGFAPYIGKIPAIVSDERERWERLLDKMSVFGDGRGQVLSEYGDIYWDVEEAALLRMTEGWPAFYGWLGGVTRKVLNEHDKDFDEAEVREVLCYQQARMPSYIPHPDDGYLFPNHNVPEYFDKLFTAAPVPLSEKRQTMTLNFKRFDSREQFARETVLWGRKSGTMLVPCEWKDV